MTNTPDTFPHTAPSRPHGRPTRQRLTTKMWLEGARLRTLPAAAAPVLVGAAAAERLGGFSWGMSGLALLVALMMQIGVNFANDYSDGIRGTDAERTGPVRLTASGAVSPKFVLAIALFCFAVAGGAGLVLVLWSKQWFLLAVGALAIIAAWFYTGGKRPYGYGGTGFAELMVFVFFGLVATLGTTWVQVQSVPNWLWTAASGIGLASVALLMVNNIRDIPTDAAVGKRTFAVRRGDGSARVIYLLTTVASAICAGLAVAGAHLYAISGAGVMALLGILAIVIAKRVVRGAQGAQLLSALRNTGLFVLAYGVLVGASFLVLT